MKKPKRGRPLTIADLLHDEALIPPERGGPFRNVRRALDGSSADDLRLRRILTEELTAFAANAVHKEQRRDGAGTDNLSRHTQKQSLNADAKALEAVNIWRSDPVRSHKLFSSSQADVVKQYLAQRVKPARRQGDRLRAMLKDGRIK
jgi:hypothetical protein